MLSARRPENPGSSFGEASDCPIAETTPNSKAISRRAGKTRGAIFKRIRISERSGGLCPFRLRPVVCKDHIAVKPKTGTWTSCNASSRLPVSTALIVEPQE
jgi:hypothetical protein